MTLRYDKKDSEKKRERDSERERVGERKRERKREREREGERERLSKCLTNSINQNSAVSHCKAQGVSLSTFDM